MGSVHNTTQISSDNLPFYLQTNIIHVAEMLSIGRNGANKLVVCLDFHRILLHLQIEMRTSITHCGRVFVFDLVDDDGVFRRNDV